MQYSLRLSTEEAGERQLNKGCKDGALNPDWAMRWDITEAWFSVLINKIKNIYVFIHFTDVFHGCGMSHAIGGARYARTKRNCLYH